MVQSNDLQKAEEAIRKAENHITTANDARTYYLKAFIYKELFFQAKGPARDQYRKQSLAGIKQCQRLDHDGTFKRHLSELENFITASLFNDGTDFYNGQKYKEAISSFRLFLSSYLVEDAHWLDAHYFIGTSYYELQKVDSAAYFLEFAKERNYDQPLLFVDLSYLYFNQQQKDKATTTIKKGVLLYPDYFDLQIAQLNILAGFGRYDTLESVVETFLNRYPDNIEALLMAGTTYQKNRTEETKQEYLSKSEKVIKMDAI